MEDTIKIFVVGLRKWAKFNNITQKELSTIIGKDQTTISNYYQDKTRPTPETIERIIQQYNLDYEEILQEGRKELEPPGLLSSEPIPRGLLARLEADVTELQIKVSAGVRADHTNDLERHLHNKHQAIIQDLRDLEKLDPAALKEIHNYIKYQLHEKQQDKAMGGGAAK